MKFKWERVCTQSPTTKGLLHQTQVIKDSIYATVYCPAVWGKLCYAEETFYFQIMGTETDTGGHRWIINNNKKLYFYSTFENTVAKCFNRTHLKHKENKTN